MTSMFTSENYRALLMLGAMRAHAEAILSSSLGWDAVYRLIFSPRVSKPMVELACSADPNFGWFDPDCDYEAVVRAFLRGIDEHIDREHQRLRELPVKDALQLLQAAV